MTKPKWTLFSWGYYGWGNHTRELLQAVDAAEASRGFKPPLFVDIRIRRSVRAEGFRDRAFETQLGPLRHRWMKSLGNRFIESRSGPSIQIAEPAAARELLDLAQRAAEQRQRVLFFCSCLWPRVDGQVHCHRVTVAELVGAAAAERQEWVEVIEWPGGAPIHEELPVSVGVFNAVSRGRATVPLVEPFDLGHYASLPLCSIVTLCDGTRKLHRLIAPAVRRKASWGLPILFAHPDPTAELADYQRESTRLRRAWGLDGLTVAPPAG